MKIAGDWIGHPGTQALCAALASAGYRALFVGGCVRNSLLGRPVADIDLSTDALPETVIAVAGSAGFRAIPTGFDFGTVTVIAQGVPHEVTTFRRDIETDGRHAVVAYSRNIEDDAARRDFTMNALYADAWGEVLDPLGGLGDLLAQRVRFVGTPQDRIREDHLRILRFFRFHAVYGDPDGGIDAEGLAACAENSSAIATLSAERVGAEMRKMLAAPNPAPSVASMAQAGVLAQVLPGATPRALAPLVDLEAGAAPRWLRRLAVLGGEDVADRLRLSRAEATGLTHIRQEIGSALTAAALGWKLGGVLATDVVLCRAAVLEMPLPPGWSAEIQRGVGSTLPVMAADLMPDLQGAALGVRLKQIESRWLASDLWLSRGDLLT